MRDNIDYIMGKHDAKGQENIDSAINRFELIDCRRSSCYVIGYLDGISEMLNKEIDTVRKEKEELERLLDEIKVEKAERQSEAQKEYFTERIF